jgi:hypothetical protein
VTQICTCVERRGREGGTWWRWVNVSESPSFLFVGEGGVGERQVGMSVDWEDEGGFSCGGAVTASKKLKKGDGGLEKQEDAKPAPRIPKPLLFIPPSRRPKVLLLLCLLSFS